MSSQRLPEMHYITEPERAQLYPAIIRISSIPSIPSNFPFKVPQSPPRTRGPRFTIGWLEFQSPEQPDPEVARPGDVWIQLPLGHRKARVYACYARDGRDWSPWVGNATSIGDRTLVRTHPFLNSDHAQRKFYLVFNGRGFTWANVKAISNIQHNHYHIARLGPADAVAKWLEESGRRIGTRKTKEERAADKDSHALSAPPPSRKRARSEANGAAAESASAPPVKRPKPPPRDRLSTSTEPGEHAPLVGFGAYAKIGATQVGWSMYLKGVELKMHTPCTNCVGDKSVCSGLPGERCGKCRAQKRVCSHLSTPKPRKNRGHAAPQTDTKAKASPSVVKNKSVTRRAPQKSQTSTKAKVTGPTKKTRSGGAGTLSRPRYST